MTATFNNPAVFDGIGLDGCYWIEWKVKGGTILFDHDGDGNFVDYGSTFCHLDGGEFCGVSFSGCGSEESFFGLETTVNPITLVTTSVSSTVRIQWDEEISPDFTYGVTVKIKVQSSTKISFKIKEKEVISLLPGFISQTFESIKISLKIGNKAEICNRFIPFTPVPKKVEGITAVNTSCDNNGSRQFTVDFSGEPLCSASTAPGGESYLFWERKVGFSSFVSLGNGGATRTIADLSTTQPHTIRVTPKVRYWDNATGQYISYSGEAFEKEFPAIQGNTFIYGPEDVYPNGSDVFGTYFELNGPVSAPVWSITPSELDDPYHFQVSPTGNSVVLFEPPVGGTATISVTGLNTVCNSTVILSKNICIHGIPNGPNNSSCPAGREGDGDVAGRADAPSSGTEKPDFMYAESFHSAKTGLLDFDVFPNLVKAGGLTTIRPIVQTEHRKPVAVTVYDMLGRVLYSKANQDFSGLEPIQTHSFSPGMFLVEVTDGRSRVVKKIIVQ